MLWLCYTRAMRIVGCFLEFNAKFVILLRHPNKPAGNYWGLPAGKVEVGESDEAAAARELFEETGYTASAGELEHIGTFIFGKGTNAYTFVTYRLKLTKPIDVKTEVQGHTEFAWVTAEDCFNRDNFVPDFHELLEKLGFNRP